MRVLHVIDSLTAAGGAERSLVGLARHLVDRLDLEVAPLHPGGELREDLEELGVPVHEIGGTSRLDNVRDLRQLIQARRPDIVHTTLFEADQAGRVAAATCRVPVVSTLANVAYGPEQLQDPQLRWARVRAAQSVDAATARLVRRFHAVSHAVARIMSRRLRIDESKVDVIPRGRDRRDLGELSTRRTRVAREALGVGRDEMVLLAVGRHEYQKGFDVLVRAMRELVAVEPSVRLLIAGREGSQTPVLSELIADGDLEERVQLLGHRDDVPDLLAAADVFVLSSRWEGMPGSVIEAMAMGLPVIASDIPMVREVVDGRCAILVDSDDVLAWEACIGSVLGVPDRLDVMGQRAARRFEEQFQVEKCADMMVGFYRRTLGVLSSTPL